MEEWKSIPGYEGWYEASNLGRIRSVERMVFVPSRNLSRKQHSRIMKVAYKRRWESDKYDAYVDLFKNRKRKHTSVARLIAMAWCDGFQDGMTVNHKDGNPYNNHADNLEWLSHKDNVNHAFANELCLNHQKPCVLVDSNGKQERFPSLSEASRNIGRNSQYISDCMIKGRPIRSISGEVYGFV